MCKSSVVLWAYLKPSASISASGKQTDSEAWEQHQEELHISFSPQRGLSGSHLPKSFLNVVGAWLGALLYVVEEKVSYVFAIQAVPVGVLITDVKE